jgi:hypothetical protein
LPNDFNMKRRECLTGGNQNMAWVGQTDLRSGQPFRRVDLWDDSFSTSPVCRNQWHVRVWDDQEHDEQTNSHGERNQWVAANIHHDRIVPRRSLHVVDVPWEVGERMLRRRLAEHCSYLDWKLVPGSDGPFGPNDFRSNGKITLILMTHTAEEGPCPDPPDQ